MEMKKITLIALAISAMFFSCSDDKDENPMDTQKPEFTALTIEGENVLNSSEELEIHLGEAFDFDVTVSDNEELSELNISIHSAMDGHEHDHARLSVVIGTDTLSWGPFIRSLSGKEATHTFSVFSETDTNFVHGEYHLEMILLDEAGNRTEKIVEFHLEEKE